MTSDDECEATRINTVIEEVLRDLLEASSVVPNVTWWANEIRLALAEPDPRDE